MKPEESLMSMGLEAAILTIAQAIKDANPPVPIDRINDLVLGSGITITQATMVVYGKQVILSGFFTKSSNFVSADIIATLPADLLPISSQASSIYAAAHGGVVDKTGRVNIGATGDISYLNPSASTTRAIFEMVWLID